VGRVSGAWAATTGDLVWVQYQRTARLSSIMLLSKGWPIFNPAKVAAHPGDSLLNMFEDEAAALRQSRRRRERDWSEGDRIAFRHPGR
jgi:hypothetical protein